VSEPKTPSGSLTPAPIPLSSPAARQPSVTPVPAKSRAQSFEARPTSPTTGQAWKRPKDGLHYVWIPAGRFGMGCSPGDTDCLPAERPRHPVEISKGFWLGQTEVPVAAWKRFSKVTGGSLPTPVAFLGYAVNPGFTDDTLPAMSMSWADARTYC